MSFTVFVIVINVFGVFFRYLKMVIVENTDVIDFIFIFFGIIY